MKTVYMFRPPPLNNLFLSAIIFEEAVTLIVDAIQYTRCCLKNALKYVMLKLVEATTGSFNTDTLLKLILRYNSTVEGLKKSLTI